MDLNKVALAEASDDVPFETFFSNANARDKGEAIPAAAAAAAPPKEEPAPVEPAKEPAKAAAEPATEPKRPSRHDRHAAISEAKAAQRAAERRAEEAERRLAQSLAPSRATVPTQVSPDDPEPQLADFAKEQDPYTSWILKRSEWAGRQAFKGEAQKAQQQQQFYQSQARAKAMKESVQSKLDAYKKTDPDFAKKIDPDIGRGLAWHGGYDASGKEDVGTPLGNLVADSELTPQLVLYFSEHKDDYRKLTALHPFLQAVEFGRIEERLRNGQKPPSKPAESKARPPVNVPKAAPASAAEPTDDDEDMSEHGVNSFIRRGNAVENRHRHLHRLR